jgi:AcrR family transcriptional regulator
MSYIAERRQEEKERRRAEILDAAEAVATEVGWDEMTMDEVARKARLSRALLYVYFKDKTDLMFGIGERATQTLLERFQAAVASHARGLEQMQAIGRAYVAFAHEFPVYMQVLAHCELVPPGPGEPQGNEGACARCSIEVQQLMVSTLERGLADGSIRGDIKELHVVAMVLKGFMHGVIQMSTTKANMLAQAGIDVRSLLQTALLLCTAALGTKQS